MGVLDDSSGRGYNYASVVYGSGTVYPGVGPWQGWEHRFEVGSPVFFNPPSLVNTVTALDGTTVGVRFEDGFLNDFSHVISIYSSRNAYYDGILPPPLIG